MKWIIPLLLLGSAFGQTYDCFFGLVTNTTGQVMPTGTGHPHTVAATCSQSGTTQTCTVPNGALFSAFNEPVIISNTNTAMDWACPATKTLQNGTSIITAIAGNTLTLTAVNSATVSSTLGTIRPARFYVQSVNWGNKTRKTLLTPQNHIFFHEAIGNMLLPNASIITAKYGGSNCTAATDVWNETLSWNFNGVMDTSLFNIDSSFNSLCPGNTLFPQEGAVQEMTEYASNNLFTSALPNGVGAGYINQAVKNLDYAEHQYTCTGVRVANLDNFDSRWATFILNFLPNFNAASKKYYQSPWVIGYPVDDTDFVGGPNAGPEFHTFPHNHNTCDPALEVLDASPIQTYNNDKIYGANNPYFYPDAALYTKLAAASPPATCSLSAPCTLRDFLQKEYGTISALNAAWSSTYTTFDSSGKCIGPTYATSGQGGNLASGALCTNANTTSTSETITLSGGTYTLTNHPVDPFSIKIINGGNQIAGDCPWYAVGCGGLGAGVGGILGSGCLTTATVVYATGVITATSTCPGLVTVDYTAAGWDAGGTGLMDESGINIAWTGNNGVCLSTPPAWQANHTYPQWTEVQDATSGTLQIVSIAGTSGGSLPSFTNTQGNTLVDGTVTWFSLGKPVCGTGGDYPAANANATMATDIGNWSEQYYAQYLAGLTNAIATDFPDFIFEGPIDSGVWSTPPRKLYIQALANANSQIAETSIGSVQYDPQYPAKLGFFTKYYTGAMTNIFYPCATAGPATCGSLFPQTASVTALGPAWYTIVNNMLGDTTYNGTNQWVAVHWWEDYPVNGGGMGIKTNNAAAISDNAFDGVEDVSASVSCSTPNSTLTCGGENAASSWLGQNMLDGAGNIGAANALWFAESPNGPPNILPPAPAYNMLLGNLK